MGEAVLLRAQKEIASITKSVTFKRVAVLTVARLDGMGPRVLVVSTVWFYSMYIQYIYAKPNV